MSINFSEDAQQEVVTSSRVLPEDSGEASKALQYIRSQPNITVEEVENHV